MRKATQGTGETFSNHASSNELTSLLHKELRQLDHKMLIKKKELAKNLNKHFSEEDMQIPTKELGSQPPPGTGYQTYGGMSPSTP